MGGGRVNCKLLITINKQGEKNGDSSAINIEESLIDPKLAAMSSHKTAMDLKIPLQ
jgi:hypothetical protein